MSEADKARFQILVCDGPSCEGCHGSEALKSQVSTRIAGSDDLKGRVGVVSFTCFGRCGEGPNLLVRPLSEEASLTEEPGFEQLDGVEGFYTELDEARVERVLDEHCGTGKPVSDLVEAY